MKKKLFISFSRVHLNRNYHKKYGKVKRLSFNSFLIRGMVIFNLFISLGRFNKN